jgi:N-acetylmuramoyl-L-alanine amidase
VSGKSLAVKLIKNNKKKGVFTMSKLIAIDDGHGMETAGKRTPAIAELGGRVIKENEFNRAVAEKLNTILKACGFRTMFTAPETGDTSLSTRVSRANSAGADLLVSIHYNANTGSFATNKASGVEVLAGNSTESVKLAGLVVSELAKGTAQKNRGVKDGSWLAIDKVRCPMILVEGGFMDNKQEAMLMINSSFQQECAEEIAKGICKFYGVAYKGGNSEGVVGTPVAESKPAPAGNPLCKLGLKGAGVKRMQGKLVEHGYKIAVDGIFGKGTEDAVKAFQRSRGLTADGICGDSTWAELYKVNKPAPAPKPPAQKPSKKLYRVIVDGKQKGAFSENDNVLEEARKAIASGADNIKIEEV